MIALLLLLVCTPARADDLRVVRSGDTVESVAREAGAGERVAEIRALNDLEPGEQPAVGAVLRIPVEGPPAHARIIAAQGEAWATPPGGEPQPLEPWMVLAPGTRVCTDPQGYASVRLATRDDCLAHDEVNLLPGTCMTVRATRVLPSSRSSLVFLDQGALSVASSERSPGQVAVETASGISVGEQGGFRVTVETEAARTEAIASGVSVLGGGVEVALAPSQGTRVRAGEAPSDPVELLPPGEPVRPGEGASLLVPDFAWTPVSGALGYRVELAVSRDFTRLVRREDVPDPRWSPEILFLPFRTPGLWWRVSAFDRAGFLGRPSEPRPLRYPAGVGP